MESLENIIENPAILEQNVSRAVETAMAVITAYGFKVLGAVIILIVGWIISGMVQNAILRAGKRTHRIDITVFTFGASVARYLLLIFTIIAMLSSFGVETTSFVAVLGAMGLAIGLALQGALGHVAAGIMLVLFRPFRVGDAIEAAGVAGTVAEISLFTTEIFTADNIKVVIPNSLIWSGVIRNLSGHRQRRFSMEIGISYSANIDEAIALVRGAIADDKRILAEPPPLVAVARLADAAVILLVEAWTANIDLAAARFDLNQRIKQAFENQGIAGPLSPRQVYVQASEPPGPN
jgi:small conductance mechanosensitive channel